MNSAARKWAKRLSHPDLSVRLFWQQRRACHRDPSPVARLIRRRSVPRYTPTPVAHGGRGA